MNIHYNLSYVKNAAHAIDKELFAINKAIEESEDPDTFGIIDQYEQMLGVGFAICQTFLTSVHCGKDKFELLKAEPFFINGKSYALLTNACANYWKHNEEWEKNSLSKQSKNTIEILESIGVDVWASYPLSNAAATLGKNNKQHLFSELLDKLNLWANNEKS